jgi:hypothetical protein
MRLVLTDLKDKSPADWEHEKGSTVTYKQCIQVSHERTPNMLCL